MIYLWMFRKQYLSSSMIAGLMRMFAEGLDIHAMSLIRFISVSPYHIAPLFFIFDFSPPCSYPIIQIQRARSPALRICWKSSDSLRISKSLRLFFLQILQHSPARGGKANLKVIGIYDLIIPIGHSKPYIRPEDKQLSPSIRSSRKSDRLRSGVPRPWSCCRRGVRTACAGVRGSNRYARIMKTISKAGGFHHFSFPQKVILQE